jgi:hypothetical protein
MGGLDLVILSAAKNPRISLLPLPLPVLPIHPHTPPYPHPVSFDNLADMRSALCPGHIKHEDQTILEKKQEPEHACYCALCGQKVIPIRKNGKWIPQDHTVHKAKLQTTPR